MPIGEKTAAWKEDEALRELPRTLLGGTRAMRGAERAYLPAHPGERYLQVRTEGGDWEFRESDDQNTAYRIRLARSVLYPFFARAVEKAISAILAKNIKLLDDVPDEIKTGSGRWREGLWENIDLRGNIGDVFLRTVLYDALGEAGVSFILVDHPAIGEDLSPADLKDTDRPYWVHVPARSVLNPDNWKMIDGVPRLTVLMVEEWTTRDADPYAREGHSRLRVLRRAGADGNPFPEHCSAEVWEERKQEGSTALEWVMVEPPVPMKPHAEIPVVMVPIRKRGEFRGISPFEHLEHLCVAHWQKLSDYDMTLYRIAPPIIHRSGASKSEVLDQFVISAGVVMYSENERADAKYVEHGGSAIGSLQEDLDRLEARILAESMEPHIRRVGPDTATGRKIDDDQAKTEIQAWAIVIKDAIEEALRLTALYLGHKSGGSVELTSARRHELTDVERLKLAAEMMESCGVPSEEQLAELQRHGLFSDDFDPAAGVGQKLDPKTMEIALNVLLEAGYDMADVIAEAKRLGIYSAALPEPPRVMPPKPAPPSIEPVDDNLAPPP